MATDTSTKPQVRWPSAQEIAAIGTTAVHEAVLMHKKLGIPIVVWEDGRAVEIPPEKIEVPDLKS